MTQQSRITTDVSPSDQGYQATLDVACERTPEALWADFSHDDGLARWWGKVSRRSANLVVVQDPETGRDIQAVVEQCQKPHRIELRLTEGETAPSEIRVRIAEAPSGSTLHVEHRGLPTEATARQMALRWQRALIRLSDAVHGPEPRPAT